MQYAAKLGPVLRTTGTIALPPMQNKEDTLMQHQADGRRDMASEPLRDIGYEKYQYQNVTGLPLLHYWKRGCASCRNCVLDRQIEAANFTPTDSIKVPKVIADG